MNWQALILKLSLNQAREVVLHVAEIEMAFIPSSICGDERGLVCVPSGLSLTFDTHGWRRR